MQCIIKILLVGGVSRASLFTDQQPLQLLSALLGLKITLAPELTQQDEQVDYISQSSHPQQVRDGQS